MNEKLINQQRDHIAELEREKDNLVAQVHGIKDEISDFCASLDGMLLAGLGADEISMDIDKRLSHYDAPSGHLVQIKLGVIDSLLNKCIYSSDHGTKIITEQRIKYHASSIAKGDL